MKTIPLLLAVCFAVFGHGSTFTVPYFQNQHVTDNIDDPSQQQEQNSDVPYFQNQHVTNNIDDPSQQQQQNLDVPYFQNQHVTNNIDDPSQQQQQNSDALFLRKRNVNNHIDDPSQQQQQNSDESMEQDQQVTYENDENILYPFGEAPGDKLTPVGDDACSEQQHLDEAFKFFGKSYNCLYVCNNGVISFNTAVSQYTPDAFPLLDGQVFITPFWGDVDTDLGGEVSYRETKDRTTLQRITTDMAKHLPHLHYAAKWAYIVTWHDVVFYGAAIKKRNTFQAVLTSDGYQYFVILNYQKIQWTTGTASEGDPNTGLGGTPAQAGFDNGDKTNYFNIPGSRTKEVLKITSTSNVNHPGRWIFEVNRFKAPGGCIFQAKFASEGVPFWKDSICSSKCLCQDNKVTCVAQVCPANSTCELMGSFYTCKTKVQVPQPEPEPEKGKTCV